MTFKMLDDRDVFVVLDLLPSVPIWWWRWGGGAITQTLSKSTLDYSYHMCGIAFENSESFKSYDGGKAS